jgi:NADH:ubiquinone oxidoreductase subunit F (NADH-binding)
VRAEYPLAVTRLRDRHAAWRALGLLGTPDLHVGLTTSRSTSEGAGAFVCGEETALIASIEGRRGIPRLRRPTRPRAGLWGRPTLINNVETLPRWCRGSCARAPSGSPSIGTSAARAPRCSRWPARCRNTGLIEVPMGITLREIVEEHRRRRARRRRFKAVQIGGPSGGCIPAALFDTPVDYDSLAGRRDHGLGRLIVLDERDLHGRRGALLYGVLPRRVLRQVHLLPHRHAAHARDPRPSCAPGRGEPDDLPELERLAGQVTARAASAAWAAPRPTRC